MNPFSASLAAKLTSLFPKLEDQSEPESELLTLVLPNENDADIGGLVIQTSEDNEIWVRIFPGHSGYLTDSEENLLEIIHGVLADQLFWVVGMKDEEWFETTLVYSAEEVEAVPGVIHHVFSWSGENDLSITA